MKTLCFSLLLFTLSLSAADVSGKWVGSYDVTTPDGDSMKGKVVMILTQSGSEVKGTVGPDEQQQSEISKGSVQGDVIRFESQTEGPLMKFELKLEGDHIRGEAKGNVESSPLKVKLDLART